MTKALQLRSGFSMPTLGMGTSRKSYRKNIADPTAGFDANEDARELAGLEHAYGAGVRLFDTAYYYGWGHSEEVLGQALTGMDRESVFVISKVWSDSMEPDTMRVAVEQSLGRLGTDYLDLLLLHKFPDAPTTLDSAAAGLDDCVDRGLVRSVGVSNFGPNSLAEIDSYTENPIVLNQVHYNVSVREPEVSGLREYCEANDVVLQAWRPLAYGEIEGDEFLAEIATRNGLSTSQVALAWLLAKRNVGALFKSDNPKHIDENFRALTSQISEVDLELISEHYPHQVDVGRVPLTD